MEITKFIKGLHEALQLDAQNINNGQKSHATKDYLSMMPVIMGYCIDEQYSPVFLGLSHEIDISEELEELNIELEPDDFGLDENLAIYYDVPTLFKDLCVNISTLNLHAGADDQFYDYTPGAVTFIMDGLTKIVKNQWYHNDSDMVYHFNKYDVRNACYTMIDKFNQFLEHPEMHNDDTENDTYYEGCIQELKACIDTTSNPEHINISDIINK